MTKFVVLGTGMAGIGAGYCLSEAGVSFTCYDKNPYLGGHTRSFRYPSGFVFDEGGHISFTKNEHVREVLAESIGGRFEERSVKIDNYWQGLRVPHPVQTNLRTLPTDLTIRIIEDFVEARGGAHEDRSGGDLADYASWLVHTYGRTFAETFPMTYGRKYHTVAMERLTTDWIGPRMYRPTLEQVLLGALGQEVPDAHYVDLFRYPSHGGFVSYLEPLADRFDIRLDHRLVSLDPKRQTLAFANGVRVEYEYVISSIPLPDLLPLIEGAPADVLAAAAKLAFTQAVMINIGLDRADISETAITYFYDEDIIFSRVNLPHMFSPHNAPDGCGTIQAEVYYSDKYRPLDADPASLVEPVVADLRRCGFIQSGDEILLQDPIVNRYANVIYDHDRADAVAIVHSFLAEVGVHWCGRYGNWDHAWTDEAFLSGESAAALVLSEIR